MTRKPVFSIPSKPIPRRTVLRGAGGIALALPFLDAMRPRVAKAATMPKRFVVFFSANGMIKDQWQPSGTSETSFTLSPILMPLATHQNDLLIMRGLANEASYVYAPNAHDGSCTTMLTADKLVVGPSGTGRAGHVLDGTCNGPSIDQQLAGVIGGATKLPSLELGVQSTTTILEPMVTRICYRGTPGNTKSVPLEDDPKKVFTRLFMDAGSSTATLDALKKKRKSVLDFVQRDFGRLEPRVSADDRAKLDRHLTTVRQFELSLDNLTTTPTGRQLPGSRRPDGEPRPGRLHSGRSDGKVLWRLRDAGEGANGPARAGSRLRSDAGGDAAVVHGREHRLLQVAEQQRRAPPHVP